MTPEEKRAWFGLGVFGVSLVLFLILLPILGIHAWFVFSLLGLYGLTPLLFRKKPAPNEVVEDERDRAVQFKANFGAHLSAYMVMFLACMIPWFVFRGRGQETVSINALPNVVFAGMFAFIVVRCAAIVILYRRGVKHDEA